MIFSRKQLADRFGIGIETLIYYEKIRLIPKPPRGANGYRVYGEEYCHRLEFIAIAKRFGFTLNDIRKFFSRIDSPTKNDLADLRAVFTAKIAELDRKIADLKDLKKKITRLLASPKFGRCDTLKALSAKKI
jgi:DNA-binding transcriptional MerR regulator